MEESIFLLDIRDSGLDLDVGGALGRALINLNWAETPSGNISVGNEEFQFNFGFGQPTSEPVDLF